MQHRDQIKKARRNTQIAKRYLHNRGGTELHSILSHLPHWKFLNTLYIICNHFATLSPVKRKISFFKLFQTFFKKGVDNWQNLCYYSACSENTWGYSSAGRALEWHSRGQRFDPAYLHQENSRCNRIGCFSFFARIPSGCIRDTP